MSFGKIDTYGHQGESLPCTYSSCNRCNDNTASIVMSIFLLCEMKDNASFIFDRRALAVLKHFISGSSNKDSPFFMARVVTMPLPRPNTDFKAMGASS